MTKTTEINSLTTELEALTAQLDAGFAAFESSAEDDEFAPILSLYTQQGWEDATRAKIEMIRTKLSAS
jgi:hypothetical protein